MNSISLLCVWRIQILYPTFFVSLYAPLIMVCHVFIKKDKWIHGKLWLVEHKVVHKSKTKDLYSCMKVISISFIWSCKHKRYVKNLCSYLNNELYVGWYFLLPQERMDWMDCSKVVSSKSTGARVTYQLPPPPTTPINNNNNNNNNLLCSYLFYIYSISGFYPSSTSFDLCD